MKTGNLVALLIAIAAITWRSMQPPVEKPKAVSDTLLPGDYVPQYLAYNRPPVMGGFQATPSLLDNGFSSPPVTL